MIVLSLIHHKQGTVETWFNDLRYNDIPGIMINICVSSKIIVICMGQNLGRTIFAIMIFLV